MRSVLLCLLGVLVVVTDNQEINGQLLDIPDFSSKFLGSTDHCARFLDLMTRHFDLSLEYLFPSKIFGSQYNERPGMAKLLSEESDRHWNEGMNVLKKYLHLGGTTLDANFLESMSFSRKNVFFDGYGTLSAKYEGSLKTMMERSRDMGNFISDLHHAANHLTSAHGDADVAHFLEEKAEKESDVARKMVGYHITLHKMKSSGIAIDIFDKNL